MEKMGDDAASKFINALIKSLQTLCHGYLDFQTGIEIIGHINLSVDKGNSLDYVLKEKVCKNAENSTLFISHSFHAEPKPEQEVLGKNLQSGNQVTQNCESADSNESRQVSSAISSISSALTGTRDRSRRISGTKDSTSSHSLQNTAKRKISDDDNSEPPLTKVPYRHDDLSHVSTESSFPSRSSPVDSKEALQTSISSEVDVSETMLPETANVRTDSSDIGVNLAGSVLEPVEEGQSNPDLPDRDDDSDGDLEVTFIKEEYVEGEGSACEFENSGGQQFSRGPHQRASEGMPDPSLFPVALHTSSSASATYVPSSHELGATGQQYPGSSGPSTSQPQPGPSGMRGLSMDSASPCTAASNQASAYISKFNLQKTVAVARAPHHQTTMPVTKPAYQMNVPYGQVPDSLRVPAKRLFVCDECNMTFTSASGIRNHKNRVHQQKWKYNCHICEKKFMFKEHYEGHLNMHFNIKAFKCPNCPKQFAYKTGVNLHLRNGSCEGTHKNLEEARRPESSESSSKL